MSDSDDDNIVRYGTQLEPYEEDHTCTMPKNKTKLTKSEKKKLRKLLSANVNVNKAREVCHLSWPQICQIIPGIEHIAPEISLNPPKQSKNKQPMLRVRPMESLSREFEPNQASFWHNPCDARVARRTSQDRVARRTSQDRVARRTSQDRVARRTSQDRVARRTYQDRVARRTSQDRVARRTSQDRVARRTSQDRVARRTSQDRVARRTSQDRVARRTSQDRVARRTSQDRVARRTSQDRVARRTSQDRVARRTSQDRVARRTSQDRVARRTSQDRVARRSSHGRVARRNSQDRVARRSSQDRGTSPNYWKAARRNKPSPLRNEYEKTNQESFLHQPYRPPQTYTQEVLHTSDLNYWKEAGPSQERAYETNRQKRPPNEGDPQWEPPYKVTKGSHVDCGELNYWERDCSPPRSRHDASPMDCRSNNSYERTQLKYSYTDALQVKVQDGMRAVNRHYNDSNDVKPFSDQPYKAQKTSSEGGASLSYWPEPDRPSRLGLRNETHPPKRAHTYSYSEDKKLKVSKYQKSSWESSDYRDSDRPLRDGVQNETQAMTTSCIYDGPGEEYRGQTYKPRSPVDEGRKHFDFSEPDRRQTTSENDSRFHRDQPSENHETFKDKDANVNKDAEPIPVGIRNITPMTKTQMTLVHQSINQAIVQIGVQGAGPKFSGSTYKTGWILMNCENHMSRKWLEKEVPSLKPWAEANLSIMPQDELPTPIILSILVPHKEGVTVATALELLRVQNPGLEIDNWKVIEVTETYSGQIVLLSVDETSFEALRLLNFKANLGMNKVGFWVRSGPSNRSGFVDPSAEDVPLASSSAYTERESNSISCAGENTTERVSRKRRRMHRNLCRTHSETIDNKPSLLGRPVLLPSGPSLPQVQEANSGPSKTLKKRWYGLNGNVLVDDTYTHKLEPSCHGSRQKLVNATSYDR